MDGILDKLGGNLTEAERDQYIEAIKDMLGKSDDVPAEERAAEAEEAEAAALAAAATAQNATKAAELAASEAVKKAEHAGELPKPSPTPCAEAATPTPTPAPAAVFVSPRKVTAGLPTSVSLASSGGVVSFPPPDGLSDGCTAVFLLAGQPGCANATRPGAGAGGVVLGMAVTVFPAVPGKYKLCVSCASPPTVDIDFARAPGTVLEATATPLLSEARTLPIN